MGAIAPLHTLVRISRRGGCSRVQLVLICKHGQWREIFYRSVYLYIIIKVVASPQLDFL